MKPSQIPLFRRAHVNVPVKGDNMKQCVVCMATVEDGEVFGVQCSNGHFHCQVCFAEHIEHNCSDDPIQAARFRDRGGEIFCSYADSGHCNAGRIDVDMISDRLDLDTLAKLIDARTRVFEESSYTIQKLTTHGAEHIPKYYDPLEMEVEEAIAFITEAIMNLRCPMCQRVVGGFDGCGAIKCYCNQHFCCWCLAPFESSPKAHEHVRQCAEGRKYRERCDFWVTEDEFNKCHRERRQSAIFAFVKKYPSYVREIIIERCRTSFEELKLDIPAPLDTCWDAVDDIEDIEAFFAESSDEEDMPEEQTDVPDGQEPARVDVPLEAEEELRGNDENDSQGDHMEVNVGAENEEELHTGSMEVDNGMNELSSPVHADGHSELARLSPDCTDTIDDRRKRARRIPVEEYDDNESVSSGWSRMISIGEDLFDVDCIQEAECSSSSPRDQHIDDPEQCGRSDTKIPSKTNIDEEAQRLLPVDQPQIAANEV